MLVANTEITCKDIRKVEITETQVDRSLVDVGRVTGKFLMLIFILFVSS